MDASTGGRLRTLVVRAPMLQTNIMGFLHSPQGAHGALLVARKTTERMVRQVRAFDSRQAQATQGEAGAGEMKVTPRYSGMDTGRAVNALSSGWLGSIPRRGTQVFPKEPGE